MKSSNIFVAALPETSAQLKINELIQHNQNLLKSPIRIEWEHPVDLHITLAYLKEVDELDLNKIIQSFSVVEVFKQLQASVFGAKIFGTAISLQLIPTKTFLQMFTALSKALAEISNKYQFAYHREFEAHLTIGRIRLPRYKKLHFQDQETIRQWVFRTFRNFTFIVREAAVMHRFPSSHSNYQRLKTFKLKPL